MTEFWKGMEPDIRAFVAIMACLIGFPCLAFAAFVLVAGNHMPPPTCTCPAR